MLVKKGFKVKGEWNPYLFIYHPDLGDFYIVEEDGTWGFLNLLVFLGASALVIMGIINKEEITLIILNGIQTIFNLGVFIIMCYLLKED